MDDGIDELFFCGEALRKSGDVVDEEGEPSIEG